jgi:hypothetical protein
MFVIHVRAKFHMPGSSASLVIAIKPEAKYRFHTATILLFYIVQEIS